MSDILLSICIPTYNRCGILDETLFKLFSNPDFDANSIEVIVSDNCSTDDTAEVVAKYPLVYYYSNTKNLLGFNFTIALEYASCKYIRIFNDTFSFKPNALGTLMKRIRMHENENKNLFFYPNFLDNQNTMLVINSIDSFFKECSFYTTWSAATGFWKKDFDVIKDKDRYTNILFPQLEWMYRIVKNGKETIIYFENLYEITIPNKKGGYNIFKTFVKDYLDIIKQEKLLLFTYELEKYRLCKYFIYPWLLTLLINDIDNHSFNTKGVFKIIIRKYWYEPYLYPMLLLFWFKKLKNKTNYENYTSSN